jgi:hypothetical protein
MGAVIGGLLPLSAGWAITPIPVTLAILLLLTAQNARPATWFTIGWVTGIVAAFVFFLVVARTIGLSDTHPTRLSAAIEILIGLGLLLLAVGAWRARPAPGVPVGPPRWAALLATLSAARSAALGFGLAAFGPKNIALSIAAAVVIAGAALSGPATTAAVAMYVILGASTVVGPVLAHAVAAERVRHPLDRVRTWLARHNLAVTAGVLSVFAVVLVGDGLWTMP